jgi:hypothetical protein
VAAPVNSQLASQQPNAGVVASAVWQDTADFESPAEGSAARNLGWVFDRFYRTTIRNYGTGTLVTTHADASTSTQTVATIGALGSSIVTVGGT